MQFIAKKHSSLRIILDPRIRIKDMGRTRTESLTGLTKLGLTVEFHDGLFETNDPKIIKALREADGYGISYIAADPNETNEPSVEGVKALNEKKAYAEEIASTCPKCGNKFKTEFALNGHMKTHNK